MICAFLPKLLINEGTNIYVPEIFLFLGIIFFGYRQFLAYKEQKLLLIMFGSILFFSIVAQINIADFSSILKSFKELLYIPIIYWASRIKNRDKVLKHLVFIGCIALVINLGFYITNFSQENTIWSGAESLSSGMSNRAFDLSTLKLVQLPGLAHGIWGSYCVLIFIVACSLYSNKKITLTLFLGVVFLFSVNMVISVSREALLILSLILFSYLCMPQRKNIYKFIIIFCTVGLITGVWLYGESLPIVQKLVYTANSVSADGTEGNIQLRLNTWSAYFQFIGENLQYFFAGLGLSPDNFYNHVKYFSEGQIVPVPESALVYMQAYGGLLSSISLVILFRIAYKQINTRSEYKLIKYFFLGILVTNLFSSVSMFSDLLYAHLCLVYGLVVLNNTFYEKGNTYIG